MPTFLHTVMIYQVACFIIHTFVCILVRENSRDYRRPTASQRAWLTIIMVIYFSKYISLPIVYQVPELQQSLSCPDTTEITACSQIDRRLHQSR